MSIKNSAVKTAVIAFVFIISACANTSITQSWTQQGGEGKHKYKRVMVLVISESQQTRRIYEDSLTAALEKEGVMASPGYLFLKSKQQINRATIDSVVQSANQNTGSIPIDSVLISYLAITDKELTMQDSPLGETYSGDAGDNMLSSTLIVGRGRFNTKEVIPLKHDLYDVQSKSIIWSVQTKTDDLTTIDAVVLSVTETLVEKLVGEELFE